MAALPLVYVHGAGPQKSAAGLKQDLDQVLFGHLVSNSRVAYYADVRWPPAPAGAGPTIAADRSNRSRRQRAIRGAAQPGVSATVAASSVVSAALAASPPPRPAGPGGRSGRGLAPDAARPAPPASALRLVEQLYRRADRIAKRSAAPAPGLAFGWSLPDPIFRLVVGALASDVVDYLYGPWAEQMRAPVRESLLSTPRPGVIVAHSLGSVILYDVLTEPALAGLDVRLLTTAGSPLGIGNVQDHLRSGAGQPNPVPASLAAWANFADPWDPVALDPTLRDEFDPPKNFARDLRVNNPAPNNHDLPGYLSVAIVQSTIVGVVGSD